MNESTVGMYHASQNPRMFDGQALFRTSSCKISVVHVRWAGRPNLSKDWLADVADRYQL